ncbi:MAG TPA: transposase [Nitrospira sp.]|nr:transposase [Nitrospira sp.]
MDFQAAMRGTTALNEGYRNGSFHSHGSWPSKADDQVWRYNVDALWWRVSLVSVLIADRLQTSHRTPDRFGPAEQSLQHWSDAARIAVPGARTYRNRAVLRQNGVFQYLTGLPSYPDTMTRRLFLLRMAPTALAKVRAQHDRFLRQMTAHARPPRRLIFDLDSTVLVVYGRQEQARIGDNPIKCGRPSYHPLLCFEGHTKDFWHGELRPGDAHTASGTLDLLIACFAKKPAGVRLVMTRADKGVYDHALIEWLEVRCARFVIVARLTAPLKRKLPHLR